MLIVCVDCSGLLLLLPPRVSRWHSNHPGRAFWLSITTGDFFLARHDRAIKCSLRNASTSPSLGVLPARIGSGKSILSRTAVPVNAVRLLWRALARGMLLNIAISKHMVSPMQVWLQQIHDHTSRLSKCREHGICFI